MDYKQHNGTYYYADTPQAVIDAIAPLIHTNIRVKFYYGDPLTGCDYHEEHDTTGTIGRTTGPIHMPILLHNNRSTGGIIISTYIVVKIKETRTGRILYQHPKYTGPVIDIVSSDMPEYSHNTVINGQLYGRHKTLRSAEALKRKLL